MSSLVLWCWKIFWNKCNCHLLLPTIEWAEHIALSCLLVHARPSVCLPTINLRHVSSFFHTLDTDFVFLKASFRPRDRNLMLLSVSLVAVVCPVWPRKPESASDGQGKYYRDVMLCLICPKASRENLCYHQ